MKGVPQMNSQQNDAKNAKQNSDQKIVASIVSRIVALVVIVIILSSTIIITKQNEYIVIRQFGEIVDVKDSPGISFKIPFLQSKTSVNKEILFYDIAKSDVITSDKKTMIVDAYVLWRITDVRKFMSTLSGSNSNAEGRINTNVYNAIKNTISNMSQNEVILSRDGKIDVSIVDEESITNDIVVDDDESDTIIKIKSLTEEIMTNVTPTEDYGIEIFTVEVKVLDLPEENKAAVYERMISERENVAASYTAQGKAEAQVIVNTTDKEISILKSDASAKAEKIIAEGEAEYMRILSEAYNDEQKSEFYSFVRSLDAAKESMKNDDNILILDEDSPIANIFYNK